MITDGLNHGLTKTDDVGNIFGILGAPEDVRVPDMV